LGYVPQCLLKWRSDFALAKVKATWNIQIIPWVTEGNPGKCPSRRKPLSMSSISILPEWISFMAAINGPMNWRDPLSEKPVVAHKLLPYL
jgi:hypothetical protein